MARYRMMVMSRPVEGREDDYNDWYQNVHLGELVQLPGIVSAQRYRRARDLVDGDTYPYLSIYEIETGDIDTVVAALTGAAGRGEITMSDAIDLSDTYAVVYEAFGEEVSADGNPPE